jgi:hypothetical protein
MHGPRERRVLFIPHGNIRGVSMRNMMLLSMAPTVGRLSYRCGSARLLLTCFSFQAPLAPAAANIWVSPSSNCPQVLGQGPADWTVTPTNCPSCPVCPQGGWSPRLSWHRAEPIQSEGRATTVLGVPGVTLEECVSNSKAGAAEVTSYWEITTAIRLGQVVSCMSAVKCTCWVASMATVSLKVNTWYHVDW